MHLEVFWQVHGLQIYFNIFRPYSDKYVRVIKGYRHGRAIWKA